MRIIIDIGHPAHVHYFKGTIHILKKKGFELLITARSKEIIFDLLTHFKINYFDRGTGEDSFFGKLLYMVVADYKILKIAKDFRPDLFLSFSTPYAAQVSFLMGKPHIALNDTEHADGLSRIFTYPFCNVILTPRSYVNNLGSKQIRFNNVVEGLYMHSKYFQPDIEVLKELGIKRDEEYAILRFVSWNAHHDLGQSGIDLIYKKMIIELLQANNYKVFISSESELPEEFKKYEFKISLYRMHDALGFASLFIGESSTMGSESALLGTPAIVINSLPIACNIRVEEDAGVAKYFQSSEPALKYLERLLETRSFKQNAQAKSIKMQEDFIDITQFLVWFIEEYPSSFEIMKNNPNYQHRFNYKQ
jgi:predicted glycosyltransferase